MSNHILKYNSPAKCWTDALPLGNGSLGAMLFSGTSKDRIALNHDTLWTGYPHEIKKDGANEAFIKARKLAFDGKYDKAQAELEKNFQTCWSQAYLPLGNLYLNFGMHFVKTEKYIRVLDISNAVSTCAYTRNGAEIKKEAFISNPDGVLVYRITSSKKLSFSVSFECKLNSETRLDRNMIITDGICPSDSDSFSKLYPCNSLIYSKNDAEKGVCFRSAVKIETDGKVSERGEILHFSGVTSATVFFVTKTSYNGALRSPYLDGREYKQRCIKVLDNAVSKGYDELKKDHIADYKKLYDRVEIKLGSGNQNSEKPTDERLTSFAADQTDSQLYELLYNYARYLLISSSRENTTATNLQGIWNEHLKAPWNSNYTVNINTEMNYWPVLQCNLTELMSPYDELMKDLALTGKSTARNYYNANGFVVHHNTDLWGMSVPTLGSASWGFWNGGSGWLCHQLFERYEYTLDKFYLESTAFPIMKSAAEFYLDILSDDGNGKLIVSPATSCENIFSVGSKNSSVAKSTTMVDSIVLDLLLNCKKSCEILGIDDSFYNSVCEAAEKIKPFTIGSKGQLLEWNDEFTETEIHHRHVSHLIGLHPFSLITQEKTPEIFEACKKTLEIRGDDGTGWSLAWKINFYARLRDGNHALKLLKMQLKPVKSYKNSKLHVGGGGGTYPNLFDAHPPFQIDGNFGAASGINEMLMQSDGKNIRLLPALPDEWKNGCVKGMLAKGNVTIDFEWKDGHITDYHLHGDNSENINVIL